MPHLADEDWSELDALVDAELDIVLALRPRPIAEPEVDEALFVEQATAFLSRHADPHRLIATLADRFRASPETDEAPPPSEGENGEENDEPA